MRRREEFRTRWIAGRTNPIFNDRKLKLGTFQTNLDCGCVMSDLDGRLDISWPNTVALARLADEMEFEAIVPVARWQGFGGATNPQGPRLRGLYLGGRHERARPRGPACSRPRTSRSTTRSSRRASRRVIDHISNGRFTLNIVTGWNKPEIDMFGAAMLPHADRYACTEEWLTIVRRLWTRTSRSISRAATTRSAG